MQIFIHMLRHFTSIHSQPSSVRMLPSLQGHRPGPNSASKHVQSPPSKLQSGTLQAASQTPLAREEREQPGEQEEMTAASAVEAERQRGE